MIDKLVGKHVSSIPTLLLSVSISAIVGTVMVNVFDRVFQTRVCKKIEKKEDGVIKNLCTVVVYNRVAKFAIFFVVAQYIATVCYSILYNMHDFAVNKNQYLHLKWFEKYMDVLKDKDLSNVNLHMKDSL